jgi:hypothetical protein
MKVTKATTAMPSPPSAGDDCPRLNSRGLTWDPVMSTGITAKTVMMQMCMLICRKKHRKPMKDQRRMWRIEVIVGDVDGYECGNVDANEED